MTTGRCLTHQRLATWQIATFSEIVSRQYAMAYDKGMGNIRGMLALTCSSIPPFSPPPSLLPIIDVRVLLFPSTSS